MVTLDLFAADDLRELSPRLVRLVRLVLDLRELREPTDAPSPDFCAPTMASCISRRSRSFATERLWSDMCDICERVDRYDL